MANKPLSYEYIRGLVEGEGCFSFSLGWKRSGGGKYKIPAFILAMHERDTELLYMVKETLDLKNKIYNHKPWLGDGAKRDRRAVLMVRDFNQLKDIIIPFFYKKLKGHKGKQFNSWLEQIGNDPEITGKYKSLYRLYKWGVYDNPPRAAKFIKFLEK